MPTPEDPELKDDMLEKLDDIHISDSEDDESDSFQDDDSPAEKNEDQQDGPPEASTLGAPEPSKRPVVRRRRKRMSPEERRVRHREVQRQFMKRKRAKLAALKKIIRGYESQRRLLQITQERVSLEHENRELRARVDSAQASRLEWLHRPNQLPASAPFGDPTEPVVLHSAEGYATRNSLDELLLSTDNVLSTMPWDDILDAVSLDVHHADSKYETI
ncbi:hypothetical protein Poli38472_011435 [Pythium oligandrum]|uniref:BZIP domain-containing protein n=1 Tax=Pythium oligandrum TaxID=41045 RepID=A0A8K1CJT0_PYTOL|nr:hypothetical protein Poli38472_011435 [Pythium oligandrum]|eukprot:TMW64555.1 hypothetical protein Poli38472_011435 [Pythium oligandrum]